MSTLSGNNSNNSNNSNSNSNNTIALTSSLSTSSEQDVDRFFNDYHFSAFTAMENKISITPRFEMECIKCIGGLYGPFKLNHPIDIPLWLALHMRETDLCVFTLPQWLRVESLQLTLSREQDSETSFEQLPFYFYEIAKLITDACQDKDDVPNMAEVLRLVNDIRDTRQRKLMRSMSIFEADNSPMYIPGIKLTNIISSEIHYLRNSFAKVLDQAYKMDCQRLLQRSVTDRIGVVPALAKPNLQTSSSSLLLSSSSPLSLAGRGTSRNTNITTTNDNNNERLTPSQTTSMSSLARTDYSPSHSHTNDEANNTADFSHLSKNIINNSNHNNNNSNNTTTLSQTTTVSSEMTNDVLYNNMQGSRPTQMNWTTASTTEEMQTWSSQTSQTVNDSLSNTITNTNSTYGLVDTPQRENVYSANSYATSVTSNNDSLLAPPTKKRRTLRHH